MSARDPEPVPITLHRRPYGAAGRRHWKSLDELAQTPDFQAFLDREFPQHASEFDDPAGRRNFIKIMGASLALAGVTGCTRQPVEKIVPYAKSPENQIPGKPFYFATAVTDAGVAQGVLVESHFGRPTKVEGNPEHPASLGATDIHGQASVLGLYDPDRSQTLTYRGEIRAWGAFLAALRSAIEACRPQGGAGLRILTETITSPTLAAQLEQILTELPQARWHQWEPASRDNARAGAVLAFGEPVEAQPRLDQADVILTLDACFVSQGPGRLRHIREWSGRRKVSQAINPSPSEARAREERVGPAGAGSTMLTPNSSEARQREERVGPAGAGSSTLNRLYAVETTPSLTGAIADHRLCLKPSELERFARNVAAALGVAVEAGGSLPPAQAPWLEPLVKDLQHAAGRSLVLAGQFASPVLHALAHAINEKLGNVGHTVVYTQPVEARPVDQAASLRELVAEMQAGTVQTLLILGGNPVYAAPADLEFGKALEQVPLRVHHGLYDDETAEHCHWHLPQAHPLEAWSDARAFDGTLTIQQPLIAPLYGGRSAHEVLAAFTKNPERSGHDIVREHWKGLDDRAWQRALHDGLVAKTALPEKSVAVKLGDWAKAPALAGVAPGLEVVFRPDPNVHDGRYANNGWLQELPKPLTKLTWDNSVQISPTTARELGLDNENVVELSLGSRTVEAPIWVVPGHPDGSATLHLGYGRTRAGRVGNGAGFNANRIRSSEHPWWAPGLQIKKTGGAWQLACTQDHWTIDKAADERHLVREHTLAQYQADPHYAQHEEREPELVTMYPPHAYPGHAWGLSVDLNACVGCNACVTACVAENNIAVIGKDQVARGREMQWIRVDRYYSGDPYQTASLRTHHQPVMCMQCENAPCEVVCPVAATTHSDEGLNDMVYNRCVGTKYCSNNCPYKVRRFNFYLYSDFETPSLKLQRNPDVTVRSRGVMEKCTYCVQRINQVRIDARNEGRAIRDGEIQTACQQVCPAEAIVFGDIADKGSRVSRLKAEPRNYGLLTELNVKPRTSYLAPLRNPNPAMPGGAPASEGEHHG